MVKRRDYDLKAHREGKREKLPAYWRGFLVARVEVGGSFIAPAITVVVRVVRCPKPGAYRYPDGDTGRQVIHGYADGRPDSNADRHAHAHRLPFGHLDPLRACRTSPR